MERLIVERVEEGTVILEKDDGTYIKKPVSEFQFTVSEGDVIRFDGEIFSRNDEETLDRKQKLLLLQKKLSEKNRNK